MESFDIIKTIHLTERSTLLTEKNNEYVFIVDPKASKPEIRKAVTDAFGKKVIGVRTINCRGKVRRAGTKFERREPAFKKAIVRLAPGETLDLV
jgi:large subunit ribosomal protein L23